MIIFSYFSKTSVKNWVLWSAPTFREGDSRRLQKALEIPGSWNVEKKRDNNALLFTKCNPSINSSSHKALRYKSSGRHANEGLQSCSTMSAACLLPISRHLHHRGAAALSCSPRTCLSVNAAQQYRESPQQLASRAAVHYTFIPPTGNPHGWLSAQEWHKEILCLSHASFIYTDRLPETKNLQKLY